MQKKPVLYLFSGLPGVGKTTLAKKLAQNSRASFLRIDTIEQALRDLCAFNVEGEGYRLSYRIAKDNLQNGNDVVADCCNPIQLTRNEWQEIADSSGANYLNIEVICSDLIIHRQRLESRVSTIPNLCLPSWQEVLDREFDEWHSERVVIDTAHTTINEAFENLIKAINRFRIG